MAPTGVSARPASASQQQMLPDLAGAIMRVSPNAPPGTLPGHDARAPPAMIADHGHPAAHAPSQTLPQAIRPALPSVRSPPPLPARSPPRLVLRASQEAIRKAAEHIEAHAAQGMDERNRGGGVAHATTPAEAAVRAKIFEALAMPGMVPPPTAHTATRAAQAPSHTHPQPFYALPAAPSRLNKIVDDTALTVQDLIPQHGSTPVSAALFIRSAMEIGQQCASAVSNPKADSNLPNAEGDDSRNASPSRKGSFRLSRLPSWITNLYAGTAARTQPADEGTSEQPAVVIGRSGTARSGSTQAPSRFQISPLPKQPAKPAADMTPVTAAGVAAHANANDLQATAETPRRNADKAATKALQHGNAQAASPSLSASASMSPVRSPIEASVPDADFASASHVPSHRHISKQKVVKGILKTSIEKDLDLPNIPPPVEKSVFLRSEEMNRMARYAASAGFYNSAGGPWAARAAAAQSASGRRTPKLRFNPKEATVCETWSRTDYERGGVDYVAKSLTYELAMVIKRELNEIKREMPVHEGARHLTQFYALR